MPHDSLRDATRRRFMTVGAGSVIGGAAVLGGAGSASGGGSGSASAGRDGDDYEEAVDAGLEYFRERAEDQLPLVRSLLDAIESGDERGAKDAYVESRYPYEEIEVLAASFEETDADIDARPFPGDFMYGETSEEFVGFHRIERLLYRDEDLEAAVPYAEGLVESVERLQEDLRKRGNFDPVSHFEGMIGLANEVPSKKITSEEETFSGQSLLIFAQNWQGIYSQFSPFASAVASHDEDVAAEVKHAADEALSIVAPYFPADQPGATPYRMVDNEVRGEIVHASSRLRDALIDAAAVLGIETAWNDGGG